MVIARCKTTKTNALLPISDTGILSPNSDTSWTTCIMIVPEDGRQIVPASAITFFTSYSKVSHSYHLLRIFGLTNAVLSLRDWRERQT